MARIVSILQFTGCVFILKKKSTLQKYIIFFDSATFSSKKIRIFALT